MWIVFILLSTLAWALVNVLNSVIVHNHAKSPVILTWTQSLMSVPLFIFLGFYLDISSSWAPILILFGLTAYAADLWFFHAVHSLDISVMNVTWSILSLLLSFVGFIFFQESWSIPQSIGAALILSGVLLLSFYHQHMNIKYTVWLLFILAVLYMPYYIIKKVAFDAGESVSAVFYWTLVGRELLSLSLPLTSRKTIKLAFNTFFSGWVFPLTCLTTIILDFLAEYWGALAYSSGPISLVSVVSNTQPFIVMGIAWLFIIVRPTQAPRELITKQSIRIKLASFFIGFIGLYLITTQY